MKNTIFLKPGKKDYTGELVSYLLYAADDTEISFETGEYHFSECGSYNRYFTPVCNRSGDKKVVFPIHTLPVIRILSTYYIHIFC